VVAVLGALATIAVSMFPSRWTAPSAAVAQTAPPAGATVSVDAARPGPSVNEGLVGVNHPVAGAGPAMRALGARWARVDAWFQETTNGRPDYDCHTGAWDPAGLDTRVELAREEGAQPLVIVDYSPACLATGTVPGDTPADYPPDLGADQARWDALVYDMAYHEITAWGVRSFEVWNEPDGTFWRGGLAGYLHLYQDTVTTLEKAAAAAGHSRIEVGGPALTFPDSSWIEPFLDFVAAGRLPLDFLSWHYYANYPLLGPISPVPAPPAGTPAYWYNPLLRAQAYGQQVRAVRDEVAAHRARQPSLNPLLWIDEWNADAGYDARQDGPYDAALSAAVLDSVQSAGLDRMSFFFVADDASDPLGNWGLLTSTLAPKPVWWAFRFWHQLAGRQLALSISPSQAASDPVGRIGAVASRQADGGLTVLVYNFAPWDPTGSYGATDPTPYDHGVTVDLTGLSAHTSYSWNRSVVDGGHPQATVVSLGTVRGARPDVSFRVSGEGVTLLTFAPTP
jgi:xylan 1,4-beta-xylosidase